MAICSLMPVRSPSPSSGWRLSTSLFAAAMSAASSESDHFVREVGVVRSLVGIAEQANGFDDGGLWIALARVDDVVDGFDSAEVRMVGFASLGGDPALVMVRIAEELLVAEVAAQEAELPEV